MEKSARENHHLMTELLGELFVMKTLLLHLLTLLVVVDGELF